MNKLSYELTIQRVRVVNIMKRYFKAMSYMGLGTAFIANMAFANVEEDAVDLSELLLGQQVKITGNLETNHKKHPQIPILKVDECSKHNLALKTNYYGDSVELMLPYAESGYQKKRCEIVVHGALRRNKEFKLSYHFKVNDNRYSELVDPKWFALMQFHNKPNKNEAWRCPILALESYNGTLRMFNRWDSQQISTTVNGTCANAGNSIQSRVMFRDIPYEANRWYKFEIEGELAWEDDSDVCLTVRLDDAEIAYECGPNTFNDWYQPYLKFGIYKPTTWRLYNEVRVEYKDIEYVQY